MFALLIAVGALFLAVAISAAIDPWQSGSDVWCANGGWDRPLRPRSLSSRPPAQA